MGAWSLNGNVDILGLGGARAEMVLALLFAVDVDLLLVIVNSRWETDFAARLVWFVLPADELVNCG